MRSILFAALAVLSLAGAAHADSATPWLDDEKLKDQVVAEVQSGGIMAVRPHAADMDRALANAKQTMALAHTAGVDIANGSSDIVASVFATSKEQRNLSVMQNPYPFIAIYLGSYYDEVGHSEDALRVMDIGLDVGKGSVVQQALVAERGAALNALKRFADSLANYDDGLKIADIDADMKARYERGRGYALTELGRLDEAEAAYNDSLRDSPGNETAENELRYIARLKAGAKPAPGGLAPLQKQP